jgi:hypothetical protein
VVYRVCPASRGWCILAGNPRLLGFEIFRVFRNGLTGRGFFPRRRPTPPAQAPPQHGPDRQIRPNSVLGGLFRSGGFQRPMKWLAKPPVSVQAWSIQPGCSDVFGIC